MAFFRLVPNLTIMAPKDFKELEDMLQFSLNLKRPVVIRYPRGGEGKEKFKQHKKIEYGKIETIKEGEDISILAIGKTLERAMQVSKMLEKEEINAEVINVRFLKPFDKKNIKRSIKKTKRVITIEDGTILNGLSTAVKELIIDEKLEKIEIQSYGYPDEFIQHGNIKELEKLYHQDAKYIFKNIDINKIKEGKENKNE